MLNFEKKMAESLQRQRQRMAARQSKQLVLAQNENAQPTESREINLVENQATQKQFNRDKPNYFDISTLPEHRHHNYELVRNPPDQSGKQKQQMKTFASKAKKIRFSKFLGDTKKKFHTKQHNE